MFKPDSDPSSTYKIVRLDDPFSGMKIIAPEVGPSVVLVGQKSTRDEVSAALHRYTADLKDQDQPQFAEAPIPSEEVPLRNLLGELPGADRPSTGVE